MASRRQKTIAVVRAQNRPVSAQATGPLLYPLKYLLPSRQRRFDLDQAAMISIKRQSVDLQPNAA
jgi:hypothetical protein